MNAAQTTPVDRTTHAIDGPVVRVARPCLEVRLQRTVPGSIAVVTGPSGTGKSELLRPLRDDPRAIYFRVGNQHSTFARFVHGLAKAVSGIAPGAEVSFARAWERALQYSAPDSVLAHWLAEHLSGADHHLIIDDLHHSAADLNIAAFVATLADLRPRAQLTLGVRTVGALPIPLWMATRRMERPIDEADLRFTPDEAIEAAGRFGMTFGEADARALLDATNGSAIAVIHALTRMVCDPPEFPSTQIATTFAQVAAAVFARRSGAERAFLFSACLYPRVDDELLRVAGWDDAERIRVAVGSDAAFIWQRDREGELRFHDRFSDYLAREFARTDEDFRSTIASRTVRTLTGAGRHADALAVATRQQLTGATGEILDAHGFEMLESGDIDTITEALDALDALGASLGAKADALHGYLDARRGRLDTAEAYFTLGLSKAPDEATRVDIAMYYARELALRRREDACEALAEFVDSPTLPNLVLIDVRSSYAQALTAANRFDEAGARTDAVLAQLEADAAPSLRARVLARAAYVALQIGAYELARERALIAAPLAAAQSLYDVAASAYSVLYNVAYEIHDDAVASLEYLRAVRDMGVKSGALRLDLYALLGTYALQAEAGDESALVDLDRQLAALDKHDAGAQIAEALIPAKALQAAWSGNFDAAQRILEPTAAFAPSPARRARCWAQVGLYCAADGDVRGAAAAIAAAREAVAEASTPSAYLALTALILALAAWVLGDRDAAAASVRDVEGGGSTRIQAMRAVLVALLAAPNEFDPDVDDIITALTGLRAAGFGGMAKLIEALPYRGGPSAAAQKSMGQVLAERELPDRFADAVKADDTQSLYDWLEARSNALPSEAEIARAFATWSAAQQVAESGSRATIEAVRQGLATYRRRSPIEIGPFDEIDLSIAALFEHLDNAAPLMAEHSRAVSAWCSRLARALDLPEQDVDFVTRGGLIHDIGKMKTPATILNAPRKLTPEEWAVMQSHVVEGAQIIAGVPILQPFAPIVRGHHERLDGKGYPDGLRGSAIPLAARIVAVADSFNAMIGRRAYRRAMSPIEALDELERSAGTQLDPEVVAAMVRIVLGRIAHKNPPG